jgi:hypothetical protein
MNGNLKMRIQSIYEVTKEYTKEMWLSIYKPHKYISIGNRSYCVVCKHSRKWHFENKNWCE